MFKSGRSQKTVTDRRGWEDARPLLGSSQTSNWIIEPGYDSSSTQAILLGPVIRLSAGIRDERHRVSKLTDSRRAKNMQSSFLTVRLNAIDRVSRPEKLATALRGKENFTLLLTFLSDGGERSFREEDARFAFDLCNLPSIKCLPVAYIEGHLSGADLAIALCCPQVMVNPKATLASGFSHPGSTAVYAAAARRLGTVACERLLFRATSLSAAEATEAMLTTIADSADDAEVITATRTRTLMAVARANLITAPISLQFTTTLIDDAEY